MPVLGSSAGAGVTKPGVYIPVGSLDRWKAVRDNPAVSGEVVVFGDSTTADSGGTYSWVYRLRSIALAAGVGDGGRGIFDNSDIPSRSGENLSGIVSRTGFATNGSSYDFYLTSTFGSTAANDTITLTGKGNRCRLHYSFQNNCGDFSYAVDGGAPTVIASYGSAGLTAIKPLLIDLGTDATHTVTVTNLGGATVPVPSMNTPTLGTGGSLTPSTRYVYVVTAVTTNGETIASSQVSVTTAGAPANPLINLQINRVVGADSFNIYRYVGTGTPTNSQLQFLKNVSSGGVWTGILTGIVDDGSVTPTSQNPPTTGTAGRSGPTQVRFAPEFYRTTGVVFHRQGISGISMNSYFGLPIVDPLNNNWAAATSLGIASGFPPAYAYPQIGGSSNSPGSRPTYRQPALAILHLGINTVGGMFDETSALSLLNSLVNGVYEFKRLCDAAGCDALVIVPHLEYGSNGVYAGRGRQAIFDTAIAVGCAVVDFNTPLGPFNTGWPAYGQGPHLNDAGYTVQAAFLWNNALSPLAYP